MYNAYSLEKAVCPSSLQLGQWNSLAREGRKLREIKKDVIKYWTSSHDKSRRIETVLARLRLGHTNITHVYLMQGQTEPPECDRCRVTITVKHLLLV